MGSCLHRFLMVQRQNGRLDGAPPGNDNAAKNHIKKSIREANKRLVKGKKVSLALRRIPKDDYWRIRSKINSDYDFEGAKTEGSLACHFVAEKNDKSRGYCVFFKNGGRGKSEPMFIVPLDADKQDAIYEITREMRK